MILGHCDLFRISIWTTANNSRGAKRSGIRLVARQALVWERRLGVASTFGLMLIP